MKFQRICKRIVELKKIGVILSECIREKDLSLKMRCFRCIQHDATRAFMPNSKIKIYTLTTCAFCQELKEYLKTKNLSFEEIDVQASQEAAKEMVKKSGQTSCPVLEYGEYLVVGFQKTLLDSIFP